MCLATDGGSVPFGVLINTVGLLISHPDLCHFNTNLLCYHSWQPLCPALLSNPISWRRSETYSKMVYKPCPQCGKSNHHNKVKCAECGVCLKAGKRGRPKKISNFFYRQ